MHGIEPDRLVPVGDGTIDGAGEPGNGRTAHAGAGGPGPVAAVGPGQGPSRGSVVPIFREQIAKGGPVTITHPDARRYLMTIPEAVCLLIQAGTLSSSGKTFVLEMGEPVLIHSLAQDLIELSGLRVGRDIKIQMTSLHQGEKLDEVLADDSTEQLLPTRFEKIHMINDIEVDSGFLSKKLRQLQSAAHRESREEIFAIFRDLNIGFQTPALENDLGPKAPAAFHVSRDQDGDVSLRPAV